MVGESLLPPKPEKAPANPWLSWPMAVVILLVAGYFIEVKKLESQITNLDFIYRQTINGWERVRSPAGYADKLRVSDTGAAWAHTSGQSVFARWDGKAWRYFNNAETGIKADGEASDFALDGEELWAPTIDGVVHFDGKRWRSYTEAAAAAGASIVAGGGEVWVIDPDGKLSHFAKGKWKTEIRTVTGLKAGESSPQLARTANGTVWLAWQGVWRWDGAAWSAVTAGPDLLNEAELIGAAGDRVWLSEASGLRSISADGKHWELYTAAQTGTEGPLVAFEVASVNEKTWFATHRGLVEFDGSGWRTLPPIRKDISGYRTVTTGPGGELWVIGTPTGSTFTALRTFLPIMLFLPVAVIVLIIWMSWRGRQRKLREHRLVAQAVQHATGEIPEELLRGERTIKWGGWLTVVMVGGTAFVYVLLRRFWPSVPVWCIPLIAVAIHLAITFQLSLTKRKPQPWDPIGPGGPTRYDWGKTWKAAAGGIFLILLWNADRFPMLSFLRGWMIVPVLVGAGLYQGLALKMMVGAMRRGHYDRALNIIRWFNFYNPSGVEALRMAGHVQLLAGQYREAEETLRRSLASAQARPSYGLALECLADALMEQGRYDEALRSYEAALYAFSWRRRPYRGMAEMLLRQGKKSEQALEWIEKIIDFEGLSFNERKQNGQPQDDYWALKAWALARLGRRTEVAPTIESALAATNKKSMPDLAATYYRAGMAMHELANETAARDYFARAVELDPNGGRGKLAKAALQAAASGWEKAG